MVQDQDWVLQLLAPEVFNHHHPGETRTLWQYLACAFEVQYCLE